MCVCSSLAVSWFYADQAQVSYWCAMIRCDVMWCDAMRCDVIWNGVWYDAMRCVMRCVMRCDAMRCDAMSTQSVIGFHLFDIDREGDDVFNLFFNNTIIIDRTQTLRIFLCVYLCPPYPLLSWNMLMSINNTISIYFLLYLSIEGATILPSRSKLLSRIHKLSDSGADNLNPNSSSFRPLACALFLILHRPRSRSLLDPSRVSHTIIGTSDSS